MLSWGRGTKTGLGCFFVAPVRLGAWFERLANRGLRAWGGGSRGFSFMRSNFTEGRLPW